MRCASRVTEEKLRVSGHTVHVCFVPAMDTVRPVTLRQVSGCSLGAARLKFPFADWWELLTVSFACFLTPALHIGVCNCRDNTAGPHCEKCHDGYYGDSTAGTSSDCKPCPCPGGSSCAVVPMTQEVVCTNCPTGTTGESALSSCCSVLSFRNTLGEGLWECLDFFCLFVWLNDDNFLSRQSCIGNRFIIDL